VGVVREVHRDLIHHAGGYLWQVKASSPTRNADKAKAAAYTFPYQLNNSHISHIKAGGVVILDNVLSEYENSSLALLINLDVKWTQFLRKSQKCSPAKNLPLILANGRTSGATR
jgi:hypothetical protein